MYKFEIFQGKNGNYYWRFRASNGEVMCSSEGYKAKASAKAAIASLKKNAPGAAVEDPT